jgi:hypothetical protein
MFWQLKKMGHCYEQMQWRSKLEKHHNINVLD